MEKTRGPERFPAKFNSSKINTINKISRRKKRKYEGEEEEQEGRGEGKAEKPEEKQICMGDRDMQRTIIMCTYHTQQEREGPHKLLSPRIIHFPLAHATICRAFQRAGLEVREGFEEDGAEEMAWF